MPAKYWTCQWWTGGGCRKAGPGCTLCWAEDQAWRWSRHPNPKMQAKVEGMTNPDTRRWTGKVILQPGPVEVPTFPRDRAQAIAVWWVGDLWYSQVPYQRRREMLTAAVLCNLDRMDRGVELHRFLFLTKRPARMLNDLRSFNHRPPRAVMVEYAKKINMPTFNDLELWFGTTVTRYSEIHRADTLNAVPFGKRWMSLEPITGAVTLPGDLRLDWITLGAETGSGARRMPKDMARRTRDWCWTRAVPYHIKQLNARRERELDAEIHDDIPWKHLLGGKK